jgi:hypothetical protein
LDIKEENKMVYKGDYMLLGWNKESSFDETPTLSDASRRLGVVPNMDSDMSPEYKDYWTINGTRELFIENVGKLNVTGTIPIDFQDGRMFYFAMGNISTTGGPTYTHTITTTTTNNVLPSMLIGIVYRGSNEMKQALTGVKVNTLNIECSEGAEVKASLGFTAARKRIVTGTNPSVESVTKKPWMFHQSAVSLFGYGSYDILSWSFNINNSLKPLWECKTTDGQYASVIIDGKGEYEIKAVVLIPDDATYNDQLLTDLIAGTLGTTTLSLIRTAGTDQIVITATNCTIRAAPYNIPEPGEELRVEVTMKPRSISISIVDDLAEASYT